MLRERGVEVDDTDADRWVVAPGPVRAVDTVIEPDLSNAAPFLALAAVSGGSVTVRDWPEQTTQAGDLLREIFAAHGLPCRADARGPDRPRCRPAAMASTSTSTTPASWPPRWRRCAPWPTRRRTCAASPTSAATRPTGSAALATELGRLGADVTEHDDGLSFRPAPLHGGVFHTYADHRMAHAGVILGAAVDGVLVEDVATTAKTFTGFAPFWAGLLDRRSRVR